MERDNLGFKVEPSSEKNDLNYSLFELKEIYWRFSKLFASQDEQFPHSNKSYVKLTSLKLPYDDSPYLIGHGEIHRPIDFSAIYDDNKRRDLKELYKKLDETKSEEIGGLVDSIQALKEELAEVKGEIKKQSKELDSLSHHLYEEIISADFKIKKQSIPVDIYLDTEAPMDIFGVYESVLDFLKIHNFEVVIDLKAIKGSWFKRMIAKSKDVLTSEEVVERLKEAEYGLEVNSILKQQSEIDKNQSEALANILKSVENISNAAIRIGSLLVVKITSEEGVVNVMSRSLSIKELYILNKQPELLQKPKSILIALSEAVDKLDDIDSTISPN